MFLSFLSLPQKKYRTKTNYLNYNIDKIFIVVPIFPNVCIYHDHVYLINIIFIWYYKANLLSVIMVISIVHKIFYHKIRININLIINCGINLSIFTLVDILDFLVAKVEILVIYDRLVIKGTYLFVGMNIFD